MICKRPYEVVNSTDKTDEVFRRRFLIPIACLIVGVGAGWFLGYVQPTATNQRELLQQYRYVRDNFHMTDAEMVDFGEHEKEYFDAMKRQDEMAAAIALGALGRLNHGNIDRTRHVLEQTISIYYRGHRDDGDTNIIRHIEEYAATNASLAHAIYRKLE